MIYRLAGPGLFVPGPAWLSLSVDVDGLGAFHTHRSRLLSEFPPARQLLGFRVPLRWARGGPHVIPDLTQNLLTWDCQARFSGIKETRLGGALGPLHPEVSAGP